MVCLTVNSFTQVHTTVVWELTRPMVEISWRLITELVSMLESRFVAQMQK